MKGVRAQVLTIQIHAFLIIKFATMNFYSKLIIFQSRITNKNNLSLPEFEFMISQSRLKIELLSLRPLSQIRWPINILNIIIVAAKNVKLFKIF